MSTTEIICEYCEKPFLKSIKEMNRQFRCGRTIFYCSLSCSASHSQITTKKIIRKCLWCKKKIESTTHKKHKVCCNKDCAVKYAQSKVDKLDHKKSCQREKTFPKIKSFICVVCKNPFNKMVRNNVDVKKTCGSKCYSELVSEWSRNNPNCGGKLGYRRFKYKGFTMDSRWEVEIAKWMDEKKIKWDRSKKRYMFWWVDEKGDKRKYFPDFYLPELDVYLDPKNDFYLQRDLPKLIYVIKNEKIRLLYGKVDDIKKEIDLCGDKPDDAKEAHNLRT